MRPPQRRIARAVRTAARLPVVEKFATIRAVALALFIEVAVRLVPLPTVCRWLGIELRTTAEESHERAPAPDFDASERRRVWAARRIMRYWPFGFGPCLREALLIGHFLRTRGPVLRLGVRPDGDRVAAHAWLELDGWTIGERRSYEPLVTGLALAVAKSQR